MADIFISYAHVDRDKVERIAAALEAAGHSVWWDRNILSGAEFSKDIQKALEEARVAVVCWSRASVESNWVKDEANFAIREGKLLSGSLDGTEPPLGFRQYQCTDLMELDAGVADLKAAIARRFDPDAPVPKPKRRLRLKRLVAPALGLAALAAVAGYFAFDRGSEPAPAPSAEKAAPAARSVAVLPFLAMSSGEDDGFFADGLTEEIINALTTVPELLVTARTSTFHFKGKDTPVPEIAKALGVAHVVEGSVRRSGEAVRITAQLVRADGFHLWSKNYDVSLTDVFRTQTEIAEHVAESLGVVVDEHLKGRMAEAGVRDVDAFVAYQKGAALWYDAHGVGDMIANLQKANIEFDKAIALAPDFADARFMRSDLHYHLFERKLYGWPDMPAEFAATSLDEDRRRFAEEMGVAAARARTPGRRRVAEYALTLVSDDWSGLAARMDAMLASDECLYLHWVGSATVFGRLDEALAFSRRRNSCDPFEPGPYDTTARFLSMKGDYDGARASLERGREIFGLRQTYAYTERSAAAFAGRADDLKAISSRMKAAGLGFGRMHDNALLLRGDDAAAHVATGREALAAALENDAGPAALTYAAWIGDRETAARLSAEIDARPYGHLLLMDAALNCRCGSPFPLDAAPNFAAQLRNGNLQWPPQSVIDWPLKTW